MGSVLARDGLEADAARARTVRVRRRVIAILVAAPTVLVPIIVVLAIYWARQSFQQSPAAALASSRTISRAISAPEIADIFAPAISLAAVLLAAVAWRILLLFHEAIETAFRHDQGARRLARAAFALGTTAVACGILGMVMASWLTENHLHIAGSYLFFFGHAGAILATGVVSQMLLKTLARDDAPGWAKIGLSARLSRLRARAAPAIAAAALLFWALFLIRDALDHTPDWLERVFSWLEIALIVSFLLYLATFSVELFRAQLVAGESTAEM